MKAKRISKELYYKMGAFANSNLFRRADSNGKWRYFSYER